MEDAFNRVEEKIIEGYDDIWCAGTTTLCGGIILPLHSDTVNNVDVLNRLVLMEEEAYRRKERVRKTFDLSKNWGNFNFSSVDGEMVANMNGCHAETIHPGVVISNGATTNESTSNHLHPNGWKRAGGRWPIRDETTLSSSCNNTNNRKCDNIEVEKEGSRGSLNGYKEKKRLRSPKRRVIKPFFFLLHLNHLQIPLEGNAFL